MRNLTINTHHFEQYLAPVIAACQAAGKKIMSVYESADFGIEYKDDDSPLTRADQYSHNILLAELIKLDAGPVLSEEDANIAWQERKTWRQYWLVDPLDGTKEFIKRNGEFTVNVALITERAPVLGVVYAPAKDLLYYGTQGTGSFKSEAGQDPVAIRPAPVPTLKSGWRIVGSRSHQSEDFKNFMRVFDQPNIVPMGSSLKLCLVADGSADLYPRLGPTSEWDTAAAQAVVEAAGGKVINWETKEILRYNEKESILNPYFIVCAETAELWMGDR